jgi:ADP-dependent NAD(P)H-hydrate dehydratase / NAD(P)H-hydrate epimerase
MADLDRAVRRPVDVFGRGEVYLPTAREAAAADRLAREDAGIPGRVLMESAGRAAALVLDRLYPRGRIAGVAGTGNNGGDLVVMLRVLQAWGRDVCMIAAGPKPPDAALLHGDSVPLVSGETAVAALAGADVIVDGVLGTGAAGPPRDWADPWIRRMGEAGAPVLALDLPSGVDASTGQVHGAAVRAECTVTFGWPKLGLLLHPARPHCGRLVAVEIGFPSARPADVLARAITADWLRDNLLTRAPDAHKSSAGRLLILAGSNGLAGAAAIAVEAALRGGAGLIRVASDACNRQVLQTLVPEATFLDRDVLSDEDVDGMHALVAGPGMGQDAAAAAALRRALAAMPGVPTLLDADALNVLATEPAALQRIAGERPLVITPHAKELSRLTGSPVDGIVADPVDAARRAAERFDCAVLLKGQPSMVAAPDGTLLVNTTGSSDVATAGMGDQLSGIVGALMAGGQQPLPAAAAGLFLSGRAADLCAMGPALTPADVSARLGEALADPGPRVSTLGLPFVTFDQPQRW